MQDIKLRGKFIELARVKTSDTRNTVISLYDNNSFTMAQQIDINEGNVVTQVYLKGAFQIQSIEHLINLRKAIDEAINKYDSSYYKE